MRKLPAVALAAGVGLLALAGCANTPTGEDDPGGASYTEVESGLWVANVPLPDGRMVLCVMTQDGLSCDWDNAGIPSDDGTY